jgi:glycosyltransferase involved in cell wall biosynthesis
MLSIIVPTYKRVDKLRRCLGSIAGAAGRHSHEIIVVDDCPDGSGFDAAKQYGARYFYKGGIDRGQSVSRNIGIKLSRGSWLCLLDDDDFLEENGLESLFDAASGGLDIIYGDYYLFVEGVDNLTIRDNSQMTVDQFLVRNRMALGSFIINKAKLKNIFDEQMGSHEDWDFLMPYVVFGNIKYINKKIAYIDKTENMTVSISGKRKDYFWMEYVTMYAKYPAQHLVQERIEMLEMLGVKIPAQMLANEIK